MATYNCKITIPKWLDATLAGPLVLSRWLWYGYTFRRIRITRGEYVKVDVRDFERMARYSWYAVGASKVYAHRRTYRGAGRKRGFEAMHREIIGAGQGDYVDHINGDGRDNRRANLRIATAAENTWNRGKFGRKSTSRYLGVHWLKVDKVWRASIGYGGRKIYLGFFTSEGDAARAYDAAAKKYHGEFAYLNFPDKKEKGLRNYILRLRTWCGKICDR